jgi:hypothetical protein
MTVRKSRSPGISTCPRHPRRSARRDPSAGSGAAGRPCPGWMTGHPHDGHGPDVSSRTAHSFAGAARYRRAGKLQARMPDAAAARIRQIVPPQPVPQTSSSLRRASPAPDARLSALASRPVYRTCRIEDVACTHSYALISIFSRGLEAPQRISRPGDTPQSIS